VDCALDAASAGDYDALLLPGGVINPDALRLERKRCSAPTFCCGG
jgi:protease I